MESLKSQLINLIGISDSEWEMLQERMVPQQVPGKTLLIQAGEVARNLYFIDSGILRTFHLREGKEVNTYFACDHQFISTFASFITQQPSMEYLEAMEASQVYKIAYADMTGLYVESPKFEKLGRILAEKNYLCVLERTYAMQTQKAKEKYLNFLQTYDQKIIQGIPQHHIASFLGIAPESLSRIRKELATS